MNMRILSLIATVALFTACKTGGLNTSDLSQAASGILVATGQDTEQNRAIIGASTDVLGSFAPMPPETEEAIGGSIAVQSFAKQGRLHPNQELQLYVNKVGHLVARQSTRPDVPYRFAVVDNDEVNAWAAPGGYIFITAGALRQMDDEAQLAGVLGHEISHVSHSHMARMLRRSQLFGGLMDGAQAASKENLSEVSSAVDASTDLLFSKGLDREMEFQADIIGAEYAAAAGYDGTGLARYLQKLSENSAAASGGGWLQSTHPAAQERLGKLKAAGSQYEALAGAVQRERFQRNVASAL